MLVMITKPILGNRPKFMSAAAMASVVVAPGLSAAVLAIQPRTEAESKDMKIYASVPTSNFSSNLNVVSPDITDFRSLVEFDLSSLAGLGAEEVVAATVRLYITGLNINGMSSGTSAVVTLSPVLGDWRENAADAGSAPLATWNAFFGPSPVLDVGGVAATQTVTGEGFFDWDVTALVRDRQSGSQGNHGVMIQAVGPLGDVGIADTDVSSQGPALIVTIIPEPAGCVLVLAGMGMILIRRRRRGA